MKIDIKTRNMQLTDRIRDMVNGELGKLEKFLPEPADARVVIKERKGYVKVEMTIPMKRYTLRVEEEDQDLRTALDRARDVMERQIRKYKTRLTAGRRSDKKKEIIGMTMQDIDWYESNQADESEDALDIVRNKKISIKPMTEDEACLQMDLLGHDFFVFEDANNSHVCIAYKRADGQYGIIETVR